MFRYIVTKIKKCSSQKNTNCKIVTSKYSDVWVKVFKTHSGNNLKSYESRIFTTINKELFNDHCSIKSKSIPKLVGKNSGHTNRRLRRQYLKTYSEMIKMFTCPGQIKADQSQALNLHHASQNLDNTQQAQPQISSS